MIFKELCERFLYLVVVFKFFNLINIFITINLHNILNCTLNTANNNQNSTI